jgi:putative phage-type endonuclease
MKLIKAAPLSPEWFEYRRSRVTGSTAAAILGVSNPKWSSPLTEWARLTNKAAPPNKVEPWHLWGIHSEPFNRKLYELATGRGVEMLDGIVQHERLDWLAYTPDGLIVSADLSDQLPLGAVFEMKAPAPWKAEAWQEAIPLEYQVQAQIGMEVIGAEAASFSALIWPGIKHFDVLRDQRFIDAALERIQHFLDYHVARDIPPIARAGEADKAVLKELAAPIEWSLSGEVQDTMSQVVELQAQISELEEQVGDRQNRLVQITGSKTWIEAKTKIRTAQRSAQ